VHINLKGTCLESVPFQHIAENVDAAGFEQGSRWLVCRVRDGVWEGAGDETKLERILEMFLSWAEAHQGYQSDAANAD
jgi:hypothetical protein